MKRLDRNEWLYVDFLVQLNLKYLCFNKRFMTQQEHFSIINKEKKQSMNDSAKA